MYVIVSIAAVVDEDLKVEEEEDYLLLGVSSPSPPPHPDSFTHIGYGALPADGDVASLYQRSTVGLVGISDDWVWLI